MAANNKFKKNTLDVEVDAEYHILLKINRKRLVLLWRELNEYLDYLEINANQAKSSLNTLKNLIRKLQFIANNPAKIFEITDGDLSSNNIPNIPTNLSINPHETVKIEIPRYLIRKIQYNYIGYLLFMKEKKPNQTFYHTQIQEKIDLFGAMLKSDEKTFTLF